MTKTIPADRRRCADRNCRQGRAQRLAAEIGEHDRRYHQEDAPSVSDAAYDGLRRATKRSRPVSPQLVRPDSPSRRVRSRHPRPNSPRSGTPCDAVSRHAFAAEDVAEFVDRVAPVSAASPESAFDFTAEPKIDGLSCCVRYEGGALVNAGHARGWRGGPRTSTRKCPHIGEIPDRLHGKSVPDVCEVRGEVYLRQRGLCRAERPPGQGGRPVYAIRAIGGRLAAPARPRIRRTTAQVLRLCLG